LKTISRFFIAALALSLVACKEHHDEAAKPKEKEKEEKHHPGEVELEAAVREKLGIKTEALAEVTLPNELEGFGQVLDPAPLVMLVSEIQNLELAAEASAVEFARTKNLHEKENASTRVLQAAELAAKRDKLALESARLRLNLAWGKQITETKMREQLIERLSTGETLLVRIELPFGQRLADEPDSVRIGDLSGQGNAVPAEYLGRAPIVDALSQGQAFLATLNKGALPVGPGSSVIAYLGIKGEALSGVLVPSIAILRLEGKAWVYVDTGKKFEREMISLLRPLKNGWFVKEGLEKGQKVVVEGAGTLWSEEVKSRFEEE
jgi:hypothetical protein